MCECGCNHPPEDPRDEIGLAASALSGLAILLSAADDGDHVPASKMHALVGIIEERLRPASDAIQSWYPPGWHPPAHGRSAAPRQGGRMMPGAIERRGHDTRYDGRSRHYPAGWWILPAAFLGLALWAVILWAVFG